MADALTVIIKKCEHGYIVKTLGWYSAHVKRNVAVKTMSVTCFQTYSKNGKNVLSQRHQIHCVRPQQNTGQNQAQQAWQLEPGEERTEKKTEDENKRDTVYQKLHLQIFPLKKADDKLRLLRRSHQLI